MISKIKKTKSLELIQEKNLRAQDASRHERNTVTNSNVIRDKTLR